MSVGVAAEEPVFGHEPQGGWPCLHLCRGTAPRGPLTDTPGVVSLSHGAAPIGIIFQAETKYSSWVLYLISYDLLSYYKY